MSSISDDPYPVDENRAVNPTLESSKLIHPQENPQIPRPKVIRGLILLLTTAIRNLGAASLQLGKSPIACLFIGLWIAQYMALGLMIYSYFSSKFVRIPLGLMLAIVGMSIAWHRKPRDLRFSWMDSKFALRGV
jgi:hypothetical protein